MSALSLFKKNKNTWGQSCERSDYNTYVLRRWAHAVFVFVCVCVCVCVPVSALWSVFLCVHMRGCGRMSQTAGESLRAHTHTHTHTHKDTHKWSVNTRPQRGCHITPPPNLAPLTLRRHAPALTRRSLLQQIVMRSIMRCV